MKLTEEQELVIQRLYETAIVYGKKCGPLCKSYNDILLHGAKQSFPFLTEPEATSMKAIRRKRRKF